jgi:fatty-acyl-CoA synthase
MANHRTRPRQDVIVSWLPLYHDMGFIACFLMPVLLRIPLVNMSPFDWVRAPYKLHQAVSQYKGTLTWLPNFAYNFCAHKIRERNLEGVTSLRGAPSSTAPSLSMSKATTSSLKNFRHTA